MKRLRLSMLIAVAGFVITLAHAQDQTPQGVDAKAAPVNAMCPIGKEPIVPSAGTVEHDGRTIGLCCPSCGKAFLAWDESRRDDFVALAMLGEEPGQDEHGKKSGPAASRPVEVVPGPYPLDTCPVSGGALGSMGDPVVKTYDGREVRFCCGGCIGKFEADQAGYFKKIDEQIIEDQLRYYPTDTCVVSGEPLVEDGEDVAINVVYQNRLVRLCCRMCAGKLEASPKKYMARLDEATADAQRKDYPLGTCVVAGGELGSMGDPTEMVVAGRLMRFCCAGCEPKVKANPVKYIAAVDTAWQGKGKFMPPQTRKDRD